MKGMSNASPPRFCGSAAFRAIRLRLTVEFFSFFEATPQTNPSSPLDYKERKGAVLPHAGRQIHKTLNQTTLVNHD